MRQRTAASRLLRIDGVTSYAAPYSDAPPCAHRPTSLEQHTHAMLKTKPLNQLLSQSVSPTVSTALYACPPARRRPRPR